MYHVHDDSSRPHPDSIAKYQEMGLPRDLADFVDMVMEGKEGSASMSEYFQMLEVAKLLFGVNDDNYFAVSTAVASACQWGEGGGGGSGRGCSEMCSVNGSSKVAGRRRYSYSMGMGINVGWAEGCVLAAGNWVEGNLYVALGKGQERYGMPAQPHIRASHS